MIRWSASLLLEAATLSSLQLLARLILNLCVLYTQVSSPLLTAYASGKQPLVQHPSGDMDAISSCLSGLLSHQQSLHHIFEGFKQAADVAYQVHPSSASADGPLVGHVW